MIRVKGKPTVASARTDRGWCTLTLLLHGSETRDDRKGCHQVLSLQTAAFFTQKSSVRNKNIGGTFIIQMSWGKHDRLRLMASPRTAWKKRDISRSFLAFTSPRSLAKQSFRKHMIRKASHPLFSRDDALESAILEQSRR